MPAKFPDMAPGTLRLAAAALAFAIVLSLLPGPFWARRDQVSAAGPGYRSNNEQRLIGPDGRPFFILGANYEGPNDRAWQMWPDDKWDPVRVEADLARASAAGLNSLRVFVQRPLATDIDAGRFGKLDAFLDLAAKHRLALMITLSDYGEEDLTKLGATAKRIAERYRDRPNILAYDLKNEPKYFNLAVSKYPAGVVPPLLADGLVSIYGEKLPMSEVDAWREGDGKAMSPTRLSREDVYRTGNHYRIYREFLADASAWVAARDSVSTMDYLDSPDSAKWRPLINAMSGTLAAWLAPQVAGIRAGDPDRLITVGYNDPILAKLAANESLTLHSLHRYVGTSLKSVLSTVTMMDNLRKTFGRPVALTEFGWSNHTIDPNDSAVLEAATWLRLYAGGHAGALKWMLDDLPAVGDPKEDNFGFFGRDGAPKPIVAATTAIASYLARSARPGDLVLEAEGDGVRYRFTDNETVFLGGRQIGEQRVAARPNATGQVFIHWAGPLRVQVTTKTELDLNAVAMLGRPIDQAAVLERAGKPAESKREGDRLRFSADPGAEYLLKIPVTALDSRIQIVWPHGNAPVNQATKANIGVYLFERASRRIACPPESAPVRLWRSANNGVEEPVAVGQRRNERSGGLVFPGWSFNDIDVSPARDPANKLFFRVSVDGMPTYGNIWSHGADARTIFPQPDVPAEAGGVPAAADAKIEIVWPHGDKPVATADKANIGVYVFHRGTLRSVGQELASPVRLWRSVNAGPFEQVAVGVKSTKQVNGIGFPVWSFNDVDISPAKDPASKVYFRASVDGIDSRSNLWSHAADARTFFPDRDVPTGVVNCG